MGAALPAEAYDAEIMEMHHRQKVDAPSGTAVGIGRAVAKGRGVKLEDVMQSGRHGHTGARPTGAIGFAALRGGQVVGEHTLIFAAADRAHRADPPCLRSPRLRHGRGACGALGGGQAAGSLLDDGRAWHGMSDGAARFAARYPVVWHVIEAEGAGPWLAATGCCRPPRCCVWPASPADGANRDDFLPLAFGGGRRRGAAARSLWRTGG